MQKYENAIGLVMFGGTAHPKNKSQSCFGVEFANSGTKFVVDFGEYVSKADLGSNIKGIVSAEGLDYLQNEADFLFISHAHEDHINGLFHIIEAGYKVPCPIVATPDTIDFIYRTCGDKKINFNDDVFKGGFLPVKAGMSLTNPVMISQIKEMLAEWKSYDHYAKDSAEYNTLYQGIDIDLGSGDKVKFFSVSHMLGSVGACFSVQNPTGSNTQLLYPADYTFDQDVFFGVPTNPKVIMDIGKEGNSTLLTDIMWGNSHINEEFSVASAFCEYREKFKNADGKQIIMAITPEYNEPLFAYMKAAYAVDRSCAVLHMNPEMKDIVYNLARSIDVKDKIGKDFKLYDEDSIVKNRYRIDICDRPSPKNTALQKMLDEGKIEKDAVIFLSQSEKYSELTKRLEQGGYNVVKMPAIKAHPTKETIDTMARYADAQYVIPTHANRKDTDLYVGDNIFGVNKKYAVNGLAFLIQNGYTTSLGLPYNGRFVSHQLCFMQDGTKIKVPENMLERGIAAPVDNSVPFVVNECGKSRTI